MTKFELILKIEAFIKANYDMWSIGTTNRPMERESELKHPINWHVWEAESEDVAMDIEELFIRKGCKGVYGDVGRSVFIFST
jgi:hypothetical protein